VDLPQSIQMVRSGPASTCPRIDQVQRAVEQRLQAQALTLTTIFKQASIGNRDRLCADPD
jgi:hypothetical protein